jgi:uncharacterized protein (TIGR01627 family)
MNTPYFSEIGPVWILSVEPPVFLTGIPSDDYLGLARAFADRLGNTPAGFIVFPTWSLERDRVPEGIRDRYASHSAQYPRHLIRFICNTLKEAELLKAQGLPAIFMNKNFTVSDQIFRPVPAEIEFDAIYNARYVPEKRHELAALVPRVAYLTYVEPGAESVQRFNAVHRANRLRNPDHVLLNGLADGRPVGMNRELVNAALARASVGLVLSEVEGSSYASMEYMLAGLPVVSTPSAGGRDVFFDPDYCIVCEPNPTAVRKAVAELQARNIQREDVRSRTLEKIVPERERFLMLIDDMVAELGGRPRFTGIDWPFRALSGVTWGPYAKHLELFDQARKGGIALRLNLPPEALSDVQLEAQEIEPVVAAIRARPGCRLLVFGCGNDSAFWEAANAGGETAFIEDNPKWADAARSRLRGSAIHLVSYRTRLAEWPNLLESPVRLKMQLSPEIAARTWDVILVDGPSGYDASSPGRMQSIFAASRLVARGGAVFVHDAEREVEAAFAEKYLRDGRLFAEARGRALLKGYAF